MPGNPRGARGTWEASAFTLVEVLVALAILAVMSLPLITSFQLSAQGSVREAHHLKALFLANMIKERMRRQDDWAAFRSRGLVPVDIPTFVLPKGYRYKVLRRPRKGGLMEAEIQIHWKVGRQELSTGLTLLLSAKASGGVLGADGRVLSTVVDRYGAPERRLERSVRPW